MSSGEAMMIHPLGRGYKRGKKVNIRVFFFGKLGKETQGNRVTKETTGGGRNNIVSRVEGS